MIGQSSKQKMKWVGMCVEKNCVELNCKAGPDEVTGVLEAKKATSRLLQMLRGVLSSKFASEATDKIHYDRKAKADGE